MGTDNIVASLLATIHFVILCLRFQEIPRIKGRNHHIRTTRDISVYPEVRKISLRQRERLCFSSRLSNQLIK